MLDDEVNAKLNKLVSIFEEALDELKSKGPADKEVLDLLSEIKDQNAAIAEAVVALADMIKDLKESKGEFESSRPSLSSPKPSFKGLPPIPPRRSPPRTDEEDLVGPRVSLYSEPRRKSWLGL